MDLSTQSGITVSPALQSTFTSFLTSNSRILKIVIENEALVPSTELSGTAFEEDFALFKEAGFVEDSVPAYYLFRLPEGSTFVSYAFVPDTAPVRQKMLYASTRSTLTRTLGDSRFTESIFASNADDLTFKSYKAHLAHNAADAPLTAREQEIAAMRQAEADVSAAHGGGDPSTIVHRPPVGLAWPETAKMALEELGKGEKQIVRLSVDIKKEELVLDEPQPTSLEIPTGLPSFTFYNSSEGMVFIYCCPSTSPVKSRMIYSSSARSTVTAAEEFGVVALKRLETSSPEEVTEQYILDELRPAVQSTTASGTATPVGDKESAPLPPKEEKTFAKPSRRGRKR